jgi:hypothetical protein
MADEVIIERRDLKDRLQSPCAPQRWRLAREGNTPYPSQETPVGAKIFVLKHTPPTGTTTKNYKT